LPGSLCRLVSAACSVDAWGGLDEREDFTDAGAPPRWPRRRRWGFTTARRTPARGGGREGPMLGPATTPSGRTSRAPRPRAVGGRPGRGEIHADVDGVHRHLEAGRGPGPPLPGSEPPDGPPLPVVGVEKSRPGRALDHRGGQPPGQAVGVWMPVLAPRPAVGGQACAASQPATPGRRSLSARRAAMGGEDLEVGAGDLGPQPDCQPGQAACGAPQLGHTVVGEVLGRGAPGVGAGVRRPAPSLVVVGHQGGERPRLLQVGDGDPAAAQGEVEVGLHDRGMVAISGPGPLEVDAPAAAGSSCSGRRTAR
jgi:hypothetical protein